MPCEGPSCTTSQFDAVIVGGGHNGLVAAFYLARAGLSVAVLEAQSVVGGACRTEELIRGFRFSTCANWVGWWRPKVLEDMKLLERGLEVGGADVHSHVLEGNQGLVWWPENDRLTAELSRFSVADARRWGEWTAFWAQARDFFGPHLLSYPPGLGELFEHARAVGCEDFLTTLLTTSLAELTDRFFESEELRASVGAPVVLPHDVGSLYDHGSSLVAGVTAAALEYSETGMRAPYGFVKGGMGRITAEMARCAEEQGATIRTNCEVQEILTYANRAYGVRLANGEEIGAEVVVANTDVHRTFLKLLPRDSLEPRFVRRIQSLRTDVAPLKLHCAMNRLPEFAAFPGSDVPYRGPVTLRPTREHHERAWEAARRGELPAQPFMVGMTPSLWDDSLAPPGKHTLSFWILYAPERPVVGTWHAKREEMAELLIKFVVRHAPEFEDALDEYVLFTPADIEERMLLSHGNMHHVDISPSQLLAQRPCPELARYKTPVDRLYLCGAGQHPYGEVSGGPGHNAAHVVLEQLGRIPPETWQQSYQANDRGAAVAA